MPSRGNSRNHAGEVSRLRNVSGQLVDMPPHSFKLPTEAFELLGVVLQREQLVDQPRDDVGAECQTRRALAFLLPLEPGTLEEWLVGEGIRLELLTSPNKSCGVYNASSFHLSGGRHQRYS